MHRHLIALAVILATLLSASTAHAGDRPHSRTWTNDGMMQAAPKKGQTPKARQFAQGFFTENVAVVPQTKAL